jgi:hypothetical protein
MKKMIIYIILGIILIIVLFLIIKFACNTEKNVPVTPKDTTSATTNDTTNKGKIDILKPEDIVRKFLTEVVKKDRSSAIGLVKTWPPIWEMFKNIDSIKIISISVISETADTANIKAIYKTFFKGKPKGGNEMNLIFTLSKEGEEWKITEIKTLKPVPSKDKTPVNPKDSTKIIKKEVK